MTRGAREEEEEGDCEDEQKGGGEERRGEEGQKGGRGRRALCGWMRCLTVLSRLRVWVVCRGRVCALLNS